MSSTKIAPAKKKQLLPEVLVRFCGIWTIQWKALRQEGFWIFPQVWRPMNIPCWNKNIFAPARCNQDEHSTSHSKLNVLLHITYVIYWTRRRYKVVSVQLVSHASEEFLTFTELFIREAECSDTILHKWFLRLLVDAILSQHITFQWPSNQDWRLWIKTQGLPNTTLTVVTG